MLDHPFFAMMGLRLPIAQHTEVEHDALMRYAKSARVAVEIGVAEGASAAGIREAMPGDGTLYLIDPFHLSRIPALNFVKRAAHRTVRSTGGAKAVWIEAFSTDAVRSWNIPFNFLLIDGDHREEGVEKDWLQWSRHADAGAVIAFHDARVFPSGWPTAEYGPVRFVNRYFRQGLAVPWRIIEEVHSLVFVSRRNES